MNDKVTYYLQRYKEGNFDEAYFGLLELADEIIPELISVFKSESDRALRKFLINLIWQYRNQTIIPFLGESLFDPDPAIWREALDGLVTLACPATLELLRSCKILAKNHPNSDERFEWLDEAISQVEQKFMDESDAYSG
jgi:hypothetical protein